MSRFFSEVRLATSFEGPACGCCTVPDTTGTAAVAPCGAADTLTALPSDAGGTGLVGNWASPIGVGGVAGVGGLAVLPASNLALSCISDCMMAEMASLSVLPPGFGASATDATGAAAAATAADGVGARAADGVAGLASGWPALLGVMG